MKDTNPDGEIKFEGDRIAVKNQGMSDYSKATKRITYGNYIHSPRWKALKKQMLDKFGARCQICNDSANYSKLELHHRTYERFENERMEDLTLLCKPCHKLLLGVTIDGISPIWKNQYYRRPQT